MLCLSCSCCRGKAVSISTLSAIFAERLFYQIKVFPSIHNVFRFIYKMNTHKIFQFFSNICCDKHMIIILFLFKTWMIFQILNHPCFLHQISFDWFYLFWFISFFYMIIFVYGICVYTYFEVYSIMFSQQVSSPFWATALKGCNASSCFAEDEVEAGMDSLTQWGTPLYSLIFILCWSHNPSEGCGCTGVLQWAMWTV